VPLPNVDVSAINESFSKVSAIIMSSECDSDLFASKKRQLPQINYNALTFTYYKDCFDLNFKNVENLGKKISFSKRK
jgi:hypothetical protein